MRGFLRLYFPQIPRCWRFERVLCVHFQQLSMFELCHLFTPVLFSEWSLATAHITSVRTNDKYAIITRDVGFITAIVFI